MGGAISNRIPRPVCDIGVLEKFLQSTKFVESLYTALAIIGRLCDELFLKSVVLSTAMS